MEDPGEKLLRQIEGWNAYGQHLICSNMPRTLSAAMPGQLIQIELSGLDIGGYKIEPDQTLEGEIVDPRLATVAVTNADQQWGLLGRRINLCVDTQIATPIRLTVPVTLQHSIATGGEFAYTYADDNREVNSYGLQSLDLVHHVAARYRRVLVDGVAVLDTLPPRSNE